MGGIDTGKEIIAALIEHRCVDNRAGGDAANNIAFYQAFCLLRIFQLLADRNFITFLHQLCDIAFCTVIRHAAHGSALRLTAVTAGQRQIKLA